jgi:hypothetical protein
VAGYLQVIKVRDKLLNYFLMVLKWQKINKSAHPDIQNYQMTKRKVLNTNTDNKVQKLVTVFADPAFYTMTLI